MLKSMDDGGIATRKNFWIKKDALRKLTPDQKISLFLMSLLLLVLPVGIVLSLSPIKSIFTRGVSYPATPPSTPPATSPSTTSYPTPTPWFKFPINWTTSDVYLTADNFFIRVNGQNFIPGNNLTRLSSDPGSCTYTTLEAEWFENGVEMRLFMYFQGDGVNWWMNEMRTYDGKSPAGWIYFYNLISPRPIGTPFTGDHTFVSGGSSVYFEHMFLSPFRRCSGGSITPTRTPTITQKPSVFPTIPVYSVTPTPTLTPPVDNLVPRITTSTFKTGILGKNLTKEVQAVDRNGDLITMLSSNLAPGLEFGNCNFEVRGSENSMLKCQVTGVPTKTGIFATKFLVKDVWGAEAVKTTYFTILPRILP